ncbi:MAG: polysaccharide biosynthesis/export family protein [Chitinophagaceae bacterium]|jgi:polysaccharide export outer membrane protein|nr:polysaccharide biosynthesis/export family protein [Chitinophagaceae bacterium]
MKEIVKQYLAATCAFIILLAVLPGCANTEKLVYFNNVQDQVIKGNTVTGEPLIQKNDILSITVSSLNADASAIFNAPNNSINTINTLTTLGTGTLAGYLVSPDGNIQFPVIGTISVMGKTKSELGNYISTELKERKLLIDPIVNVRFLNFRVSVLGEVARPGVFTIPNEKLNILEALGLAGDITIYGKKENVLLIREDDNGQKVIKRLNLNSQEIFNSPYYFLRSNDVIYVEPSKDRVAREKTTQILPIVFSLVSLLIVVLDRVAL